MGALTQDGWVVEITKDYPYQIVSDESASWEADVVRDGELPDWFSLELGVVVDGKRVNLLPLVLDFVDHAGEEDDLKSIARRLTGSVALPVSETHHVRLPVERFRALVRVVIELYQGVRAPRAAIRFPAQRATATAHLADWIRAAPKGLVRDEHGVVGRGRAVLSLPKEIEPMPELRATLRSYQREGVAFLQHLREIECGGILADDMGLGKTLQTIAHLSTEKAKGRLALPALIITPTSLAFNWSREIDRFAPHLNVLVLVGPRRGSLFAKIGEHDVVIATYPILVRDIERLDQLAFSTIVLDEAQAIKNARSQTHRALERLAAEHRICLSGTPVENDLGELWALFHFLEPALLGAEASFKESFRVPIEFRADEARMESLREIVGPYVLRRNKRDVAPELPEKTELLRPVELGEAQRELYEQIRVAAHAEVRGAIRKKGLAASAISILDAITKLRQVCCDPRLVRLDEARGVSGSAKYEALLDLLSTEIPAGRRALVFSQFTSMLALIAQGLTERGIDYTTLTGQTRDRRAAVDEFEGGKVAVFLISLKAGGTGLNLISADTVIHYDPWWNPASQAQATDRAYRIGQTKPVFVHHLYVAGSVEERVLRLQKRKAWLAGALLGEAPAGASPLTELDVERLLSPLDS
jgi:SNF2 family DNA or RNA helicase